MALPSIARRLRTKHPLCLSLTLLHHHHPISNSSYSSLSLHHHLSQPFHPTPVVPSQTPRHFSTLQFFSAEIPHQPLGFNGQRFNTDHSHNLGLTQFLELLTSTSCLASEADAVAFLDESGVEAKRDMVFQAIWELRGDWKLAFLGFKWGEKWGCCDEEACSLMVWVLGSHGKFSTAWCLIRDLNQALIDTRRAMLIMIDRIITPEAARSIFPLFQRELKGPYITWSEYPKDQLGLLFEHWKNYGFKFNCPEEDVKAAFADYIERNYNSWMWEIRNTGIVFSKNTRVPQLDMLITHHFCFQRYEQEWLKNG